jgi:hypothetical protein
MNPDEFYLLRLQGHQETAAALLSRQADARALTKDRRTPMHYAAQVHC